MQSVQYTNTEDSAHGVHWNTGLESERELKPERVREGEKEQARQKGLSGKRRQCLSSATEHRGRESRDRTRERAQQWSRFIKDNGGDDKK